jgi:rhodanese-related sulfurtransferase
MKTVDAREVAMTPDAMLIDVRTPGEFGGEHIDGAISLPLDALREDRVRNVLGDRRDCVVVCQSGRRATTAAERLTAWGFSPVVLAGGLNAWKEAGNPVKRGRGVISIERQVRIAAGSLVLLGVGAGLSGYPGWFGLAVFVGAGLVFAGITDFCGMGLLLARMPWNQRTGQAG